MKSRFLLIFIIIALLHLFADCQILNYWAQPLSATTMRPTFVVQGKQGFRIKGSVEVSDKQAYVVYFFRPNQYYPTSPAFQYFGFVGSGNFTSLPLDRSGLWRIEVVPDNRDQYFIILVKTQKLDSTYDSYVDVARYKKIFVTYFSQGDRCNFSVDGIAAGQQQDILIEMYQGSNYLDFSASRLLYKNTGVINSQYNVNCIADITGYYYIFISANQRIMSMFPRVLVSYQSNNYPCPISKNYQDINLNFPTCIQIPVFDAVYPCINYDSTLQTCTSCDTAFILQQGSCYNKIDCGLDQYFDKGQCYDVIANCDNYELVGGRCKKCIQGYSLQANGNNQACILIPPNQVNSPSNLQKENSQNQNNKKTQTSSSNQNINQQTKCPSRTYLNNGFCVIIPDSCLQFDDYKKMCVNCASSFTLDLDNLNCIPSKINCPMGYYNLGNNCVALPLYCNKTNSWGNCTSCIINYTLSVQGICQPIRCKQRQFLSNGQCFPVSQTCDTFDIFKGYCLTCITGYLLDSNGKCIVPQYAQQKGAYNGCPPRQYRQGNLCRTVDARCNLYDQTTGYCISCIDPRQILDKSAGICYKVTQLCQDRFYFDEITRTCVEVSTQCQTYDQSNGYCLTCRSGLSLIRGGCMYVTPCGNNQYRNQDGLCVSADPNCDGFDQISGACLGCKNGYELNSGGICCYAPNYLLNQSCKQFLSQNCKSQRPIFLNCQQCQPGYSLYNGVFGKCKFIQ